MKKFLIVLITVALIFSVLPLALSFSKGPPEIRRVVFIHWLHPGKGKPPDKGKPDKGGGDEGGYKLIAGGIKWPADKLAEEPVQLVINPTDSWMDSLAVWEAIYNAANFAGDGGDGSGYGEPLTWDEAVDNVNLFDDDPLVDCNPLVPGTNIAATPGKLDGINLLAWGPLGEGVIAVCYLWYRPKGKEIVDFDIVFSTSFQWRDAQGGIWGNPSLPLMDLQNIATHELGHGVGLADIYNKEVLTMYGYSSAGETKKRDLAQGDIDGIRKLYGKY